MTERLSRAVRLFALVGVLSGCIVEGPPISGPVSTPPGMKESCIAQAVRLTGAPQSAIVARAPISVGPENRPFIGLNVAGASYGCRIEDDGSYTVFSEYAN
ncbi:hypothetical protein [Palleronia pelagia]|uniref:Lipoprotein n=1 Tax=Palleronia pelagia TaxID=387096 RepID=A0A1H8DJE7_9RHOB|nr:hypothetical protein [Palleronia pelagia]SEN07296.1 hypothetical protein SAMN04488011_102361 [Palleronia pelagia]